MSPSQTVPPWYKRLSVDLFLPSSNELGACAFFAWILPLMVLARGVSWDDHILIATVYGAGTISLVWILSVLNQFLAYGSAKRVQLSDEVIVITGGATGLGLLLAETFGMKGATVAVLDVVEAQCQDRGVTFYKCDVGQRHELEMIKERISIEVSSPLASQ